MKIGLIGRGFVGNCVYEHLKPIPYYSLDGGDFNEVDRQEYIFLCLPTPFNGKGFDISALEENIEKLSPKKKIIIKSTILPGTTEKFASRYNHEFFFNPEFLVEKTALDDYFNPDRQIVGHINNKKEAERILELLPDAPYKKICGVSEAEMAKLAANNFLALKVIYANEVYDYCQKKGVNYEEVIDIVKSDRRIGGSHFGIFTDGYRGYGGHCFPKDMKATAVDSGSKLLKVADEINEILRILH